MNMPLERARLPAIERRGRPRTFPPPGDPIVQWRGRFAFRSPPGCRFSDTPLGAEFRDEVVEEDGDPASQPERDEHLSHGSHP